MLASLLPRSAHRYLSLPLFGPLVDDFDNWLLERGYSRASRRNVLIPTIVHMDQYLRGSGIERIQDLTPQTLQRCWKALQSYSLRAAGTAHVVERFLKVRGLLNSPLPKTPSPTSLQLAAYADYLREVRGFAPSTVHRHLCTVREFLAYWEFNKASKALATVDASDLDGFVRKASRGVERGSFRTQLQHCGASCGSWWPPVRSPLAWRIRSTLRAFTGRNSSREPCLGRRLALSSNQFLGRLRWPAATTPCSS
jgi:integrase/recombinase XerD